MPAVAAAGRVEIELGATGVLRAHLDASAKVAKGDTNLSVERSARVEAILFGTRLDLKEPQRCAVIALHLAACDTPRIAALEPRKASEDDLFTLVVGTEHDRVSELRAKEQVRIASVRSESEHREKHVQKSNHQKPLPLTPAPSQTSRNQTSTHAS